MRVNEIPSHRIHFKHSYHFLKSKGIKPNVEWIRNIDLLIDEPEIYAKILSEFALSDNNISNCIFDKINNPLIIVLMTSFGHDMRTQRYSRKKTGWSKQMISVLRRFFSCLYGEKYGLLVDLHVLLDMAFKWCCDDDLLIDWASEVELHPSIIEYYKTNRNVIDSDLSCTYRSHRGNCKLRNVAKMVRNDNENSNF